MPEGGKRNRDFISSRTLLINLALFIVEVSRNRSIKSIVIWGGMRGEIHSSILLMHHTVV